MAPSETIAYYTECWAERLRRGHNSGSHAIHYGLDFDPHEGADAAKLRTNAHVAERLGLDGGTPWRVLDLGCGVGGTVTDLARRHPRWRLTGVDATPASLALARELAHRAGVTDRVRFVDGDYGETKLGERFDGVYAVESLCHAPDRDRVAGEVRRLLEPGAPFVVVDLFRTASTLDAKGTDGYRALCHGFAMADYYDEPLEDVLLRAGFVDLSTVDLTARAAPSLERSAARAREALHASLSSPRPRGHLEACIAAAELLGSGHLRYRSLRAYQPRVGVSNVG